MGKVAPAIRIGDMEKGMCDMHIHSHAHSCPHSRHGQIMADCSNNVFINGLQAAYVGSGGMCNCFHSGTFKISEGSGTVFINGRAAARTKDVTTCELCAEEGNLGNGSSNVFIGD